ASFLSLRTAGSTIFPYATLFRSKDGRVGKRQVEFMADAALALTNREISEDAAKAMARAACEKEALRPRRRGPLRSRGWFRRLPRSEEHTSELQSRENLVCRLLLE